MFLSFCCNDFQCWIDLAGAAVLEIEIVTIGGEEIAALTRLDPLHGNHQASNVGCDALCLKDFGADGAIVDGQIVDATAKTATRQAAPMRAASWLKCAPRPPADFK